MAAGPALGSPMRTVRGSCARRKSLFPMGQCHHTPSQYSCCHTARHTFRLQLRSLAFFCLPPATPAFGPSFLPLSVQASVNVTSPPSSPAFPVAPIVYGRLDASPARFNITDAHFAFRLLSYYPLLPAPITFTVMWTSTACFLLYLPQKFNFVLQKKTSPPPHCHGDYTERNGELFFLLSNNLELKSLKSTPASIHTFAISRWPCPPPILILHLSLFH